MQKMSLCFFVMTVQMLCDGSIYYSYYSLSETIFHTLNPIQSEYTKA